MLARGGPRPERGPARQDRRLRAFPPAIHKSLTACSHDAAMRWRSALFSALLVACPLPAGAQTLAPTPARDRALERIKAHYATGDKDQARADAEAAASEG